MHRARPARRQGSAVTLPEPEPTIIHIARLTLRPFAAGDVDDVFAYASDPEWSRYLLGIPEPYTRHDAEAFVARQLLMEWETDPHWAIVLDGRVIGAISLAIEGSHQRAGLGYGLAREHWGKGLTTEAARSVVTYAFESCGVGRVFASTDARNLASQRVLDKAGFEREGVLRGHRFARGEYADEVRFGLLREDWGRR